MLKVLQEVKHSSSVIDIAGSWSTV